jgi:alkyldihydroxyacetonephosphate synthase
MSVALDRTSLLADVPGSITLGALERELGEEALSLGVPTLGDFAEMTVAHWLARGAPGAASAWGDPADHLVAGLEATLTSGKRLVVRPGPRRAVGPDLIALFFGTGGRLGRIERAWLRVHRRDAARPALPLPALDLDPPPSDAELRLLDQIAFELDQ